MSITQKGKEVVKKYTINETFLLDVRVIQLCTYENDYFWEKKSICKTE